MLQGEGVAYRGRILVELSTLSESKPVKKNLEMIPNDDLLVVEVNPCFTVTVGCGDVTWLVVFRQWSNSLKSIQYSSISRLREVVTGG